MPNYTTDQYISKIDKAFLSLVDVKPHVEILSEVVRRQQDRVFNRGVDGKGKTLDKYSTKPIYVSLKAQPRKQSPKGKNGSTKFKNGQLHTSTYFSGGYAEFKQKVGKGGGGRINLVLFGNFRTAFINSIKNPYTAVSQSGIRVKTSITANVFNPSSKLDGIFDRFPFLFHLTKGEKGYVIKRVQDLLLHTFS